MCQLSLSAVGGYIMLLAIAVGYGAIFYQIWTWDPAKDLKKTLKGRDHD